MSRIKAKFIGLRIRMIDAFRLFPIRLKRFFLHFFNGILTLFNSSNDSIFTSIILWWSELVYIILDLFWYICNRISFQDFGDSKLIFHIYCIFPRFLPFLTLSPTVNFYFKVVWISLRKQIIVEYFSNEVSIGVILLDL